MSDTVEKAGTTWYQVKLFHFPEGEVPERSGKTSVPKAHQVDGGKVLK